MKDLIKYLQDQIEDEEILGVVEELLIAGAGIVRIRLLP